MDASLGSDETWTHNLEALPHKGIAILCEDLRDDERALNEAVDQVGWVRRFSSFVVGLDGKQKIISAEIGSGR